MVGGVFEVLFRVIFQFLLQNFGLTYVRSVSFECHGLFYRSCAVSPLDIVIATHFVKLKGEKNTNLRHKEKSSRLHKYD